MADPLNELVSASVRAWATVARAWIENANEIWLTVLDAPAAESDQLGFNEETVLVPAQPAATGVRPGRFADADDSPLPAAAISIAPANLVAGADTEVCVRIEPPPGSASGTYTGSLWDSSGSRCIVDEIGVYVVGDRAP